MNFNDYRLPNEREFNIMNQNYSHELSNKTNDLKEILDKMNMQKEALSRENTNGSYDLVIHKLESNINELSRLIWSISNTKNHSVNSYSIPNVPSELRRVQIKQNEGDAISPIRSDKEIAQMRGNQRGRNDEISNSPLPETPTAPNIPDISNRNTRSNNYKRNRPMQGNILSTIFKKFAMNNSFQNSDDGYRNKYHTEVTTECISIQKIRTNQIDIIRLLLLYIALNPNCRYCSRIATITNEQFEILQEIS